MTVQQAFTDFWNLIHTNGTWAALPGADRQKLSREKYLCFNPKPNKKGSLMQLTPHKAFVIINKYAPGKFRVVQPEAYFERV